MSSLIPFLLLFWCLQWLLLPMSVLGLQLRVQDKHVVMENDIVEVTISNPQGMVTGIRFNGIGNLLEGRNEESDRGYWDLVWAGKGIKRKKGLFDRIKTTNMTVITQNEKQLELSFTRMWDSSLEGKVVPLKLDKRFIMSNGSSGFYTYAIYERLEGWPAIDIANIRLAFKLNKDMFHYMAIAENRKREMPLPDDRLTNRSQALAYPEAVLLVNPIEPQFKGEVDDKYQYNCESKDARVHGWISSDPPTGMWQITPSNEFRSGGPTKQYLTSHVGPTSLTIMHSTHYAGAELTMKFEAGEPWKKLFGPVFVYVNSLSNGSGNDPKEKLWEDANKQMMKEVESWPYNFVASKDFPPSDQRGSISGKLMLQDGVEKIPAKGAYVGLAAPGDVGSWQTECKSYQFWTTANADGSFSINNIRTGKYNLYAWVPGFIGDYKYDGDISIASGSHTNMDNLVYKPLRDGVTIWEIGIPDRSAAEFYIPDPNPKYTNKLYVNHPDKFRQYGLWERYADLYPEGDLVYTAGVSDYRKDWFFMQVTRKKANNTYQGTTWKVKFKLDKINKSGTYKLRLALATANNAQLEVRVNDPSQASPLFSTGLIGHDNTIARHGIHGLYRLFNVDVQGSLLVEGDNVIFLTQAENLSPFEGIMYDYIRLEGPPSSRSRKETSVSFFLLFSFFLFFLCVSMETSMLI